jgi:hypothetical protein
MIADETCPECHGAPVLDLVRPDRLVKHCADCGHKWNEPRELQHDPKAPPWRCLACIHADEGKPGLELLAEHDRAGRDANGIDRKGYVRR